MNFIIMNEKAVRKITEQKKHTLHTVMLPNETIIQDTVRPIQICGVYQPGEVIYVKEPWDFNILGHQSDSYHFREDYLYKAMGDELPQEFHWRCSSTMPREAARLFLRMGSIRKVKKYDLLVDDIKAAGFDSWDDYSEAWDTKLLKPTKVVEESGDTLCYKICPWDTQQFKFDHGDIRTYRNTPLHIEDNPTVMIQDFAVIPPKEVMHLYRSTAITI